MSVEYDMLCAVLESEFSEFQSWDQAVSGVLEIPVQPPLWSQACFWDIDPKTVMLSPVAL